MPDFKPIFDAHFFSNHHVQAQAVETQLEDLFPGCECVTFANLESLLIVVAGELCATPVQLFNVSAREAVRQSIESLSRFLSMTGRTPIHTLSPARQATLSQLAGNALSMDAWLVREHQVIAQLLDASGLHPMLAGAGLFITPDAALSEKIRWARSSYGRRGASSVRIFANGRFSEFQAILLKDGLKAALPCQP
jgi:hypothetical protein